MTVYLRGVEMGSAANADTFQADTLQADSTSTFVTMSVDVRGDKQ